MIKEYLDKAGLQLYHNKVKQEVANVKSQLEDIATNIEVYENLCVTLSDGRKDWSPAIKQALMDCNNVIFGSGKTFCFSEPIIISKNNINIYTLNECIGGDTIFEFVNDTDGIIVEQDVRYSIARTITLKATSYSTKTGILFKSTDTTKTLSSLHYLTFEKIIINGFKVAIGIANDTRTFLWNCIFKDIRSNSCETGINWLLNGNTSFGIIFERVYFNGSLVDLDVNALSAEFIGCNFGIKSIDTFKVSNNCSLKFNTCNFECDTKVLGTGNIWVLTSKNISFENCSFPTKVASTVSYFSTYANMESVTFKDCSYKSLDTNELVDFFSKSLSNTKPYAIKYISGCNTMPRPNFYTAQLSNFIDLEKNKFPQRIFSTPLPQTLGENGFDIQKKMPCFFDGKDMVDFIGNTIGNQSLPIKLNSELWLDGGEIEIPTSGIIDVPFNIQKFGRVFLSTPNSADIIVFRHADTRNTGFRLVAKRWDSISKDFVTGLTTTIKVFWFKITTK